MLEQLLDVKNHYYTGCNSGLYKYAGKGDDSAMEVEFGDADLDRLETDARFTGGHSSAVVKAYRKRLNFIRQAKDERDLYMHRGHNFEKLQGNRSHQHSMRLNDQWRLILELRSKGKEKVVYVVSIADYH
jgi:proteic killer suppression protein